MAQDTLVGLHELRRRLTQLVNRDRILASDLRRVLLQVGLV